MKLPRKSTWLLLILLWILGGCIAPDGTQVWPEIAPDGKVIGWRVVPVTTAAEPTSGGQVKEQSAPELATPEVNVATSAESYTHTLEVVDAATAPEDWQIFDAGPSASFVPTAKILSCAENTIWMTITFYSAMSLDGVWSFDGQKWQQHFAGMSAVVACSPGGIPLALVFDSSLTSSDGKTVPFVLYRWQDGGWLQDTSFTPHPLLLGLVASTLPLFQEITVVPSGDLWFTGYAALRFAGQRWSFYSLQNEQILGDLAKNITELMDETQGAPATEIYADPLVGQTIIDLEQDADGILWLMTDGGTMRLKGEVWESVVDPAMTSRIGNFGFAGVVDIDGAPWMASSSGAVHLENGTWILYTLEPSQVLFPIAADPTGPIWFLVSPAAQPSKLDLLRYDGTTTYRYALPGKALVQLSNLSIQSIIDGAVGPDGALWFAGIRYLPGGLPLPPLSDQLSWASVDAPGGPWTTYTPAEGLANLYVQAITAAPDGSIWIATWGGANRITPQASWQTYTVADGLISNRVNTITATPDGSIWFGTDSGVSRLQPEGMWTEYTTADGLAGPIVNAAAAGLDGSLWFAVGEETNRGEAARGVSRLGPDGIWTTFTIADGLATDSVRALAAGPDGSMWFGTTDGVSRLQPDGLWKTYTTTDGLANDKINAMEAGIDGSLWIGTAQGISYLSPDGVWTNYTSADGLMSETITAITAGPDGTVWVGTTKGLSRFSPEHMWSTITQADGLASNRVEAIALGPDGSLWVATDAGVSRYQPAE